MRGNITRCHLDFGITSPLVHHCGRICGVHPHALKFTLLEYSVTLYIVFLCSIFSGTYIIREKGDPMFKKNHCNISVFDCKMCCERNIE